MTDSVQRAHTLAVAELTTTELCWRINISSAVLERLAIERRAGNFYTEDAKVQNESSIMNRLRDIELAVERLWQIL